MVYSLGNFILRAILLQRQVTSTSRAEVIKRARAFLRPDYLNFPHIIGYDGHATSMRRTAIVKCIGP